jgi:hypothetical protein
MLHLSFTQQLCHVSKFQGRDAANDTIFGTLSADEEQTLNDQKSDDPSAWDSALRDLAQRLLKNLP